MDMIERYLHRDNLLALVEDGHKLADMGYLRMRL